MAISSFNIPTSAVPSSYSGYGNNWQSWSQNTVQPLLTQLLGNYSGFVNNQYQNASSGLTNYLQGSMKPAMQSVLNQLAARGMVNSSTASDTMSKTLSTLGTSVLGQQANLSGQAANTISTGLPNLALNSAQFGQYSSQSNPLAPYQVYASLLSGLM